MKSKFLFVALSFSLFAPAGCDEAVDQPEQEVISVEKFYTERLGIEPPAAEVPAGEMSEDLDLAAPRPEPVTATCCGQGTNNWECTGDNIDKCKKSLYCWVGDCGSGTSEPVHSSLNL